MCRLWASIYLSLLFPLSAVAHEFWIEPTRYRLEPSEKIVANLRVGQYFKGNTFSFVPEKFVEFSVIDASGKRPVNGRLGDLPAVNEPSLRTGLHILVHHSTVNTLTYSDFTKFERFARKEGNAWLLDAHKQRGLSRSNVTEAYTRYAKALVLVGNDDGQDEWVGMPFEIVTETNPYADSSSGAIFVRLLWNGRGMADKQVSIFRKHGGCEATRTTVLTDTEGRASIPREPGGRFLLNSVHVVESPAGSLNTRTMWQSFWAST
ncbi:MAG: DUF4198 domain-containing protein, partial [Arenicellales bacterium]|nr:DUF4198 domain-containing protein [Arenicellales bacterium]